MNTTIFKLTKTENKIAILIAQGRKHESIQAQMLISYSTYRVHLCNIKRKLGCDELNAFNTRRQLEKMGRPMLDATDTQKVVLRLLASGMNYPAICKQMGIAKGTAMNYASQGKKRLGYGWREAVKMGMSAMDDPMF